MTNRILFAILILLSAAGTALGHAPAVDDGGSLFTTTEEAPLVTGNVLDNDIGTTKSVQSFDTTGTIGLVTDNGDGTFLYDPNGQFNHLNNGENATDSFTYVLWDGGAPDIATVTMTITGVSPPPSGVFAEFAATVQPGEFKIIPNSSPYQHFSWPATVEAEIGPDAIELCARINCNIAHGQMDIYPGMAWDIENEIGWLPNNGGHGNSFQGSGVMRYVFGQSWERLTHPTRLYTKAEADADPQNGYLADRDGDGTNDDCLNFLDGNQAVHYYDGFTRIPGSNKIVMGGVTAMCWQETTQAQTAPWVVWTFDTATLKTERLPLLDPWNNYSTSAFAETVQHPGKAPGALYWKGNNNFVVVVATNWDDTSTWEVIQEVNHSNPLPIGYGSMQVMGDKLLFNHQYHLNSYTISPDGTVDYTTRAELINFSDNWPAGWSSYFAARGMAPAGDKVVFWDGRHRIEIYDTINNTRTFLPQTCNPAQRTSTGTFSMWEYLPKHDVFIGAASSTDGVVLYRLPDTYTEGQNDWNMNDQLDCTPWEAPPVNPNPPPSLGEGEIFKWDMDSDPIWRIEEGQDLGPRCNTVEEAFSEHCYGQVPMPFWASRDLPRGNLCPELGPVPGPKVVTEADGNKALQFTFQPCTESGAAGNFMIDVTKGLKRQIIEGDRLELQFSYKLSESIVLEDNKHRGFRTTSGGMGGPKIFIFSNGNDYREGKFHTRACMDEFVLIWGWDQIVTSYNDCNWYQGHQASYDNGNPSAPGLNQQPGGPICDYYGDPWVPRGWNAQMESCFNLDPDVWYDLRVIIDFGSFDPDRKNPPDNRIQVFGAERGGSEIKVIDFLFRRQDWVHDDGYTGHGNWWLSGFVTGKDKAEMHREGYAWYDNLRACLGSC